MVFEVEYGGTAEDLYGNTKSGFEIAAEINRNDFGLNWQATAANNKLVVSDKVKLIASLQFTETAVEAVA